MQRMVLLGLILFVSACSYKDTPAVQVDKEVILTPVSEYKEWILIDTTKKELRVIKQDKVLAHFDNIALGVAGTGIKQRKGDGITPLGVFTIGWVNHSSRFKHFIGLNYPSLQYAEKALQEQRLSEKDFERIKIAINQDKVPPQDTELGGQIGIHGVGRGSLKIHKLVNWTDGCIALTNQQISELVKLVRVGMMVKIQ